MTFKEEMAAFDHGYALMQKISGEYMMNLAKASDFNVEVLYEYGKDWRDSGQARLDKVREV